MENKVLDELRNDSVYLTCSKRNAKKIALTQAIPRKSPNAGCCLVYLSQVLLAKGYVRGHCHDTIRIGLFFFSFSFKNQGKKKKKLDQLCRNAPLASFLTDKEQLFH